METKPELKNLNVGEAAVEGLLNGILAGVVMALVILGGELVMGISPLNVLGNFDVTRSASPLLGLFTHVAVAGMYGVMFGLIALVAGKSLGARMNLVNWLGAGALYGLLIFAIAEWIILPRTASPLQDVPMWLMALAHLVYGIILAWLGARNKNG